MTKKRKEYKLTPGEHADLMQIAKEDVDNRRYWNWHSPKCAEDLIERAQVIWKAVADRCGVQVETIVPSKNNDRSEYFTAIPLAEQTNIDWEQRRYELVKAMLPGLAKTGLTDSQICEACIAVADTIIKRLKDEEA